MKPQQLPEEQHRAELHLHWFFVRLLGKVEDGEHFLFLWQRDRQVEERIERDGDLKQTTGASEGAQIRQHGWQSGALPWSMWGTPAWI